MKTNNQYLKNMTLYSIYVRNHKTVAGRHGMFTDVMEDLDRIKDLGVDILWLLPIHPIGEKNKKGSLGCPYSIADYDSVNPLYGSEDSLKDLIDKTHEKGMKIIIDVVYNHTSHDAKLLSQHPDYYYRKADGSLGNRVADWDDIIDLDYSHKGLWEKQISSLEHWIHLGIDGFRCDVASLVPLEFWQEARRRLSMINPQVIMIAESVHGEFINHIRKSGIPIACDSELFSVFDVCYDYDTHGQFLSYLHGNIDLETMLEKKRMQSYIYPDQSIKLRFLENHDMPRISSLVEGRLLENWTGFSFFEAGLTMVHGGQEKGDKNCPSLFEIDPVNWDENPEGLRINDYIGKWINIRKKSLFQQGYYTLRNQVMKGIVTASYESQDKMLVGVFNVEQKSGDLTLDYLLSEGWIKEQDSLDLVNLYNNQPIEIHGGKIKLKKEPLVFELLKAGVGNEN